MKPSNPTLVRVCLKLMMVSLQPFVTTDEIDKAVHEMVIESGAYPSPLGYGGFPKSVCTSVNECMFHGVPDSRQLQVLIMKTLLYLLEACRITNQPPLFFRMGI